MNPFVATDGRLRAIWRFLLGLVVVYMAMQVAASVALQADATQGYLFESVYRPGLAAFLILGFSVLLITADRVFKPLWAMGLGRTWRRDTAVGLLVGGGMVVVAAACIAVAGKIDFTAVLTARVGARVLVVVFILATAAMGEELAFRGYPFQRLVEAVGPWPAVILSSISFGVMHYHNPHSSMWAVINTALIGAVLSHAYLRTRALWLPFGIHLGWNATLGLLLGLPVSGLNEFSVVVRGHAHGASWLTGGSYGIEASAVGTGVILLGFLALIAFVPQKPAPSIVETEPALLLDQPPEFVDAPSPIPEATPDGAHPTDSHPSE